MYIYKAEKLERGELICGFRPVQINVSTVKTSRVLFPATVMSAALRQFLTILLTTFKSLEQSIALMIATQNARQASAECRRTSDMTLTPGRVIAREEGEYASLAS